MSANERSDTVFECIRGGAEDYLLKPVTKKEVQYIWQHVWRRLNLSQPLPSEVTLLDAWLNVPTHIVPQCLSSCDFILTRLQRQTPLLAPVQTPSFWVATTARSSRGQVQRSPSVLSLTHTFYPASAQGRQEPKQPLCANRASAYPSDPCTIR